MRVLIAPDSFGTTLTSVEAARAIAQGWSRHAPHDELDLAPLADGGPGFIDVVHTSLGGDIYPVIVQGPVREPVPAEVLIVDGTAYIESAQSCGLHLVPVQSGDRRDPTVTSSYGLGECIAAALDAGARRIVVGIGGTGTNDAGAGALAALGASSSTLAESTLAESTLADGGLALRGLTQVDLTAALGRIGDVELVVATDVDVPLLGLRGATNGFAPQKGATDEQVMQLEGALEHFVGLLGRRADGKEPAVALGAGAGGGIGYALIRLGARRVPGLSTVQDAIGLVDRIRRSELIITGEGTFDWQSLRGKVVSGVATAAQECALPTVVLAGQVMVGRREFGAIGVEAAYSMTDLAGSVEESVAHPHRYLADLAERVSRTWSR